MSSIKLQSVQPLFYSPLSIFEVDSAEALNRMLLTEIAGIRSHSEGLSRSNWNGWHSEDDFFQRCEPACHELRQRIVEAIRTLTRTISPNFDFSLYDIQAEGWVNVLGRGGLNTPHDHPAWVWSGCYYVSVPEGDQELSGAIEFLDSRTNVRTLTVDGAACFASKFLMKPKAGMLLMFPSYLRHWVYPNESDDERVTIAFNARFARNGVAKAS